MSPKCLVPACRWKLYARGLCRKHYNLALYMVSRGETTWGELAAHGKAREPKRGKGVQRGGWLTDFKREADGRE